MRIYQPQRGMTLIEVLVTFGIIVIVATAVITFFKDTFTFNRHMTNELDITGTARRALRTMVTEVRVASPSSLGAYPILQTATSSFIFYGNIDADPQKERIRYFRSTTSPNANSLMRGVTNPSGGPLVYDLLTEVVEPIARNVVNDKWTPIFSYYDSTYSGTQASLNGAFDVSLVRLVKINLVIDSTGTSTVSSDVFSSQVSMRNLKDNL